MKINKSIIRGFRNYDDIEIVWHPDINIIYGSNAQGKTNLLESIAYLSTASSFREHSEEKLENWNSDFFFLEAQIDRKNNDEIDLISAGYQQKRKLWKKNGNNCRKISEIVGFLHTVVFTPDDLEIVKKGPDVRRYFLDMEMLQLFPGYHLTLANYKKALLQRNNLLKQIEFERIYAPAERDSLLLPWEEELAKNGSEIILKRRQIIEELDKIAARIHLELSNGLEKLRLEYETCLPFIEEERETVRQQLLAAYAESRLRDLKRGSTSVGPHRDDFKIAINGVDVRSYGSQGQQRTAALSVKFSEVELVKSLKGYFPILLLDDVFSELDAARRSSLLKLMLNKTQIFITTTGITDELQGLSEGSYNKYRIEDGNIIC